MKNNQLTIAAAGSGKTTHIINEAMKTPDQKVLITTYTIENENEIRNKFFSKYKCIPKNITIQTWFSFLIKHGVKPYQGTYNNIMFNEHITGLNFVSSRSAAKYDLKGNPVYSNGHPLYYSEDNFKKHFFTKNMKIYSDKLSKFVFLADKASCGEVISRISRIYSTIYIDEVQDLAGYDLEIIKLLFKSSSAISLVGDPRQVTYLTHNEAKNKKYAEGNIRQFIMDSCKSLIAGNIDEDSLSVSHRNNKEICHLSSKLYPQYLATSPCLCCRETSSVHNGIFLVRNVDKEKYLAQYNPIQLRWSVTVATNPEYLTYNFGESKGKTFDRVLIYPTKEMKQWLTNMKIILKNETRAKFYVGITRAKFSVGIIYDFNGNENIQGVNLFNHDKIASSPDQINLFSLLQE